MQTSIHHPSASAYTVFLDGYNVIKRFRRWDRLPLVDGRQRLIESATAARWPFPVRQVTIVFDGPVAGRVQPSKDVLVIFATPSADACIRDALHHARHPERYVLISSDGELQRTARSHGTRYFPAEWFLDRIAPSSTSPARRTGTARAGRATPPKTDLPAATARHITEELAKRWLGPAKQ